MSDLYFRELQRQAYAGDLDAKMQLLRLLVRSCMHIGQQLQGNPGNADKWQGELWCLDCGGCISNSSIDPMPELIKDEVLFLKIKSELLNES